MPRFLDVTNAGSARTALGATATGSSLFTAADTPAARTVLGEDPYRVERLEQIKAAATVWSNLVTGENIAGGVKVPVSNTPLNVVKPTAVTAGGSNLLSGMLPFTSFDLGTNTLPTGITRQNASASKVLYNADGDSIDVEFTNESGQTYAGALVFTGWTPPSTGRYLVALTVQIKSATTDTMRMFLRLYNTSTSSFDGFYTLLCETNNRDTRRIVARVDITSTDQRLSFFVNSIDADKIGRFALSDLMVIADPKALPRYGSLLSVPPYSQGTTSSSDITFQVPAPLAGEHMVLVNTAERGWIASRGSLSAGSNSLTSLFPDAHFTCLELLAVPSADWLLGDLDVVDDQELASVRYLARVSADYSYPQAPADVSRMVGQAVFWSTGRAGTDRPYAMQMGRGRGTLNRFRAEDGDRYAEDTTDKIRSEVDHGLFLPFGTDIWISFWVNIDRLTPDDVYGILLQARYTNNTGDSSTISPDFSFGTWFEPGLLHCTYRTDGGVANFGAGLPAGITSKTTDRVAYTPNRWHRSVLKLNFSDSGGGSLSWWWDGAQVADNLLGMGYDRNVGPHLRQGIYTEGDEGLGVTYQHFEVTTDSLQSRIASPLPI